MAMSIGAFPIFRHRYSHQLNPGKKEFAALAQSLLPASDAASYNQGMMDFGAIQCTPQSPKCLLCPLAETCEALRCGRVEELPVKEQDREVKTRHLSYIY